jgi:hypothetical protein
VRADDAATLRNHVAARCDGIDETREVVSAWLEDGPAWLEDVSAFVASRSARRANRSVFAEVLSKCVGGRLGIRRRPPRTRPGPVGGARGSLLVPSGLLGAAPSPVLLWTERLPMARGRLGIRGRILRSPESASSKTETISPKGERLARHSGDVLSQHRAVRFERGEAFLEGREARSPHRAARHAGRAVIQPCRAVRPRFRDDRSSFVESIALLAGRSRRQVPPLVRKRNRTGWGGCRPWSRRSSLDAAPRLDSDPSRRRGER